MSPLWRAQQLCQIIQGKVGASQQHGSLLNTGHPRGPRFVIPQSLRGLDLAPSLPPNVALKRRPAAHHPHVLQLPAWTRGPAPHRPLPPGLGGSRRFPSSSSRAHHLAEPSDSSSKGGGLTKLWSTLRVRVRSQRSPWSGISPSAHQFAHFTGHSTRSPFYELDYSRWMLQWCLGLQDCLRTFLFRNGAGSLPCYSAILLVMTP